MIIGIQTLSSKLSPNKGDRRYSFVLYLVFIELGLYLTWSKPKAIGGWYKNGTYHFVDLMLTADKRSIQFRYS